MTGNGSAGARRVTVIPGDGIGPEIVTATRRIIDASGARVEWEERAAGESVFLRGLPSGVPPETITSITETGVALKGPLGTPVGYGEKSANVTLRKLFETYGNLRPVREMPGVRTPYSGRGIDLVVVRENVEDLYAGIEHQQTPGVAQCLKLISHKGCEKIARLAFEVARAEGRTSVACMTKSNIMKLTEGQLKRVFEEVAEDYPGIESWHVIIDNGAHQLVKKPEQYEVIVTTNMNGDIISDLTSALVGGLGFAPSANLGNDVAIFEAVHGTAPKYAGRDVINPTSMILSGVMMLRHIGEFEAAAAIEHAVMLTLEEGRALTRDVVGDERAKGTTAYTDAIIANLGRRSETWVVREHAPITLPRAGTAPADVTVATRRVVGADLFVESGLQSQELGPDIERLTDGSPLRLKMISSRGTKVYPPMGAITDAVDHWRCRFVSRDDDAEVTDADVLDLIRRVGSRHRWMHVEKLQEFDGEPVYTRAQGED
jgi:isocitrate dehydrogenase